jgi:hypothetical protein
MGTFSTSNYAIAYVTNSLTISTASLTISSQATSKTYGATALLSYTAVGLQNNETLSSVDETTYAKESTSSVGIYAISISGAAGSNGLFNTSNYVISYVTNSLTITTASLTISSLETRKTYGSTATLSYTAIGLQNSDSLTSVIETTEAVSPTATVGFYAISISGATASTGTFNTSNYSISYSTNSLIITPASLTITSLAVYKTYGNTASLTYTIVGLQNSDSISSVTESTYASSSTVSVGTYAISIMGATGGLGQFNTSNYAIAYVTNSLTISPASLTITSLETSKSYGSTAVLSYTYTSLQNSDSISSVNETTLGLNPTASVGTYAISISGVTSGSIDTHNYAIVYVTNSLTVSVASLTINAIGTTKTYGSVVSLTYSTNGLKNNETITSINEVSEGNISSSSVGTYSISISGASASIGGFSTSNYAITYVTNLLTVATASLTINAIGASKSYGSTATLTYSVYGLKNNESITSLTETSEGVSPTSSVGSYAISIYGALSGGQFNTLNYSISYSANSLIVSPSALTISSLSMIKTYGQVANLNYTVTGLQNNEIVQSVDMFSLGSATTSNIGLYYINISNALGDASFRANNYSITYAAGTMTIVPKQLAWTIANSTMTSGSLPVLGKTTLSGVVNGDSISPVISLYNSSGLVISQTIPISTGSYSEVLTGITGLNSINYSFYKTGSNANPGTLKVISSTPMPTLPPTPVPTPAPTVRTTSAPSTLPPETQAPTSSATTSTTPSTTSAPNSPASATTAPSSNSQTSSTPSTASIPTVTTAPIIETVEALDSGSSMFGQISSSNSSNQKSTAQSSTSPLSPSSSSSQTSSSSSSSTSSSSSAQKVTDSNEAALRSLEFLSQPAPLKAAKNQVCKPLETTKSVVPGLIDSFHPSTNCSDSNGNVPGIAQNYSASGNSSLW